MLMATISRVSKICDDHQREILYSRQKLVNFNGTVRKRVVDEQFIRLDVQKNA